MTQSYYVYILRCSDDSLYVGHTDDLDKRIAEHAQGVTYGYTRSRRPLRLVYCEEHASRDEAFHRKRQLKVWSRAKKEALIRGQLDSLPRLSAERAALRRLRFDDWGTDVGGPAVVLRQAQDERQRRNPGP